MQSVVHQLPTSRITYAARLSIICRLAAALLGCSRCPYSLEASNQASSSFILTVYLWNYSCFSLVSCPETVLVRVTSCEWTSWVQWVLFVSCWLSGLSIRCLQAHFESFVCLYIPWSLWLRGSLPMIMRDLWQWSLSGLSSRAKDLFLSPKHSSIHLSYVLTENRQRFLICGRWSRREQLVITFSGCSKCQT